MNVLFVDDQINVLNGIASGVHFDDLGIEQVFYATSGEQAMVLLNENHIDLMLSDVEMPGEDGLSLNRRVRDKYPDVVRILLTAHADFEYAQESTRLGCFDYLLQPAAHEDIEAALRRALHYIYERKKHNQIYRIGKAMQTSEMELLDRVTLNLFSSSDEDMLSSIELLNLMGYPLDAEKKNLLLVLRFEQFRKTETPIVTEKEIHKAISNALWQADITYPVTALSTVDHRRQFLLLLSSATGELPEICTDALKIFFDKLSMLIPENVIDCYVSVPTPLKEIGAELRRLQDIIRGKDESDDVIHFQYDANRNAQNNGDAITGSGARWRALLAAGQKRILFSEFDDCLEKIQAVSPNKLKAMCDLHQRMTHMFLDYFYNNGADIQMLFQNEYSYSDYMGSFTDADSLRNAFYYMLCRVDEIKAGDAPKSDVEKAKSFIAENIADPITVRDVAEHVCLSAEYFTKLFKRETGQNIKEYITLMKIEAAKDMLENSSVSVGMVALELGYTNFSHFSQVFKKYENMSPSEYRDKLVNK